jgi:hypothetical protein
MAGLNMFIDKIEVLHGKISNELKAHMTEHFIYYWSEDRLGSLAKEYWKDDTSLTSFS